MMKKGKAQSGEPGRSMVNGNEHHYTVIVVGYLKGFYRWGVP